MKTTFLTNCLLSFLFFAGTSNAAPKPSNPDAFINQSIPTWMHENNIPGVAVEIYKNGIPHSYYFGYADSEHKIPVSGKTIFQLGSVTKLFTTLLVAETVNSGKMQLNAPVGQYLPDLFAPNKSITILNLATHTSGLPNNVANEINSRVKLQNYFGQWFPPYTVGSQWAYSNVGMGLLGFALETATHRSIDQLYRDEILAPLHMQEIGFRIPQSLKANYAQGFSRDGKAVSSALPDLFPAAYSMKASSHDMLLFLKAALNLPGTPAKIQKAMRMTETPYFSVDNSLQGLAWEIHPLSSENKASLLNPPTEMKLGPLPAKELEQNEQKFNGDALIDKTGATNGFRSYIALIPNQKSGIVILTNRYVSNREIVKMARTILFKLNT